MSSEHPLWEEIQQGEGKTLELKKQLPRGDQLAKTLVAFANTSGGKLVIGVDDQRQVVGVPGNEFDLMDQIASMLYSQCQPTLLPNIYLETLQGKTLIIVQVHRGSQLPYHLKNQERDQGVYVRLGATNRPASLEMIHELERQRLLQSYDEQAAWQVKLSQLDTAPLQEAFKQAGKLLDTARMKSLKLIREEQGADRPTHGLMILLGLYEQVEIKCSRFKGTSMAIFLDKKEYRGDLFSQLAQTEAFIKNHLNLKAEILSLQRTETYEIPIPAIREALINAVVHRDYSNSGRDIKVGIYDDLLNIVSPGGLPNGLTLEEALKGRSEIRNKVIARVFKELGYIEQWGSGMSRIRELCQKAGNQEPAIHESGDFVDIEFMRDINLTALNTETTGGRKGGPISGQTGGLRLNLTERQQEVLALLQENPNITRQALAEKLNINTSAIQKHLEKLKATGAIERVGGTRGYWKVKP